MSRGDPQPVSDEMTVRQAAELLSVSPDTVRRYIAEGRLAARNISTRPGGRPQYRVLRSEVTSLREAYCRHGWTPPEQPRRAMAKRVTVDDMEWINLR